MILPILLPSTKFGKGKVHSHNQTYKQWWAAWIQDPLRYRLVRQDECTMSTETISRQPSLSQILALELRSRTSKECHLLYEYFQSQFCLRADALWEFVWLLLFNWEWLVYTPDRFPQLGHLQAHSSVECFLGTGLGQPCPYTPRSIFYHHISGTFT